MPRFVPLWNPRFWLGQCSASLWWGRYAAGLSLLLGAQLTYGGFFTQIPTSTLPKDSNPEKIRSFLQESWDGKGSALPVSLSALKGTAELDPILRESGLCWVYGFHGGYQTVSQVSLWRPRATALQKMLALPELRAMEAVEVGLATNLTLYNHEVIPREQTGLWGILLRCSTGDLCLTPNQFPRRGEFPDGQSLKYMGERMVLKQAKFQELCWVLRRDKGFRASQIARGESVVPVASMSRDAIGRSARNVALYEQRMLVRDSGQLPYLYRIRTGDSTEEGRSLVSTCLGSLSLANFARFTGLEIDRKISERHLKTMIARFGHSTEGKSFIADSDSALLGAQALFALALRTQPRPDAFLQAFEKGLARAIRDSRRQDGRFDTKTPLPGSSTEPATDPEKDVFQNAFPGLALTYLARLAQAEPAHPGLAALDKSLEYYDNRFRRRPDRLAVPWLAEAWSQRYRVDKSHSAGLHAIELADWNLNNLQEWGKMEPQLRGAPVNPDNMHYGPLCFTYEAGAQLQGLVAARWVAHALGDSNRSQRYDKAILEISRYLMQMQVKEKGELYWLPEKLREDPQGALRDCPWDETVQIESCASALNAWLDLERASES